MEIASPSAKNMNSPVYRPAASAPSGTTSWAVHTAREKVTPLSIAP
jgi:hypothetical protein